MSSLERLVDRYADHIATPWPEGRSGIERVIFIVYAPRDELRLRVYIDEFGRRTREAGHGWLHLDLTDAFPSWMSGHRFREKYFRRPELMSGYHEGRLSEFTSHLVQTTGERIAHAGPADVIALSGMGTLFGVSSVSELVERSAPAVAGRLLVFFPGALENFNYRLLDARDGWGYMAHAIAGD